MAIALRGAAVVPAGNPTTGFTAVIPSAVLANDLIFLTLTSRDSTGAGTLAVTDNDTGGNAWVKIGNSTDHKATLWWKRATSGTASKTVTVANAVGSCSGVLKAFSGADTGVTPYANVGVETNASTDESHAGFTPGSADSLICAAVFNYANDNAVTSLSFATAGAATFTEKLSTGGSDCANAFGHVLQSGGPSAAGTLTWAQTDGTTYSMVWTIKPVALTNYTLTAESGAYTHTGTAAALKFGRTLMAAAGSYAEAGTAATLVYTRIMPAVPGSYAMSGTAAALTVTPAGTTLVAESGAYVMTGSAASLLRGGRVLAGSASWAMTGTAAGLRCARLAVGDPGAYMMTGTAAQLSQQDAWAETCQPPRRLSVGLGFGMR